MQRNNGLLGSASHNIFFSYHVLSHITSSSDCVTHNILHLYMITFKKNKPKVNNEIAFLPFVLSFASTWNTYEDSFIICITMAVRKMKVNDVRICCLVLRLFQQRIILNCLSCIHLPFYLLIYLFVIDLTLVFRMDSSYFARINPSCLACITSNPLVWHGINLVSTLI